ncbi:MAG: cyclic nucleotide-binding domain-containing protein [Sulfurisoma sp.]|nr:cyclic nucleotide-binding domain-containing protein [Sulfurisoma sp.]
MISALGDISRSARRVEFPKGQTIFRVGEPARELFFLLSGQAKRATFSVGGNEKVLELLMPGQSFGEAELFGARPYASFVVAVEPTVVLCVGGDSVRRTLETAPQLSMRIIGALAKRAIDIESAVAASHFRTGCQRLLDYLLAQVGSALEPNGQMKLTLTASKQLIASRIGMTSETLSRVLRELADAGMIVVDGRNIPLQNTRIASHMATAAPEQPVFPRKNRHSDHAALAARRAAVPNPCTVINMSGRQRMLSQRMAKFYLFQQCDIHVTRSRVGLAEAARESTSALAELAVAAKEIPRIEAQLDLVSQHWDLLKSALAAPSHADGKRQASLVSTTSERLLRQMDAAVGLYEALAS